MDKRRVKQSAILAAAVIVIIILVLIIGKIIQKYTPTKEEMDLYEYFGVTEQSSAAIVLNHEIIPQQAVIKDGMLYVDYDTLKEVFNSRFYWDTNENLLLYTTPSDVISAPASGKEYYITKEKKSEKYTIVFADGETAYIALEYVKKFTDMDYRFYEDPDRIVVTSDWSDASVIPVKKDTQIRVKGGIKSPILAQVESEENLILLEEGEDWHKVATETGIIGYARSKKLGEAEQKKYKHSFEKEEFSHILKEEKINMGWHQVTTKDANRTVSDVISKTKGLNVISPTWFYLNDNEGGLMNLASKEYVDYCHSQGVEVWALVSNLENKEVDTTNVLTHTSKRTNMVNQLIAAAIQYDFDGINVDFEAIETEAGEGYIQFIRELSLKCENNGIILSVDNYVPTEYTAFYNRSEQANFADYVIIMGYDEHYSGSEDIGSVASIGFVREGVENTLKEVPPEQTILGMPFYSRVWELTPKDGAGEDVESAAEDYLPYTFTCTEEGMQTVENRYTENGAQAVWSDEDGQYTASYEKDGKTYKMWIENETSLEEKLKVMKQNHLAGAAYWKLGLERPSAWDTIIKYVN